MTQSRCTRSGLSLIAILIFLCGSSLAAGSMQVAQGDIVPLSGYASGSQSVYLFLTGPNLPANGVQLDDITKQADQGYFTRIDVDSNDHWSYKWNTAGVGGHLDEGTYTVWVASGPNDRAHLAQADYSTISVTLTRPFVAVGTAVPAVQQNGAMDITSAPPSASVSVDGLHRGTTPLLLSDIPAGTYNLTFSLNGYADLSSPVTIAAGRTSEVRATLYPLPPAAAEPGNTPATAPTTPAVTTTGTIPATSQKAAGLLPALCLAGLLAIILTRYRSR
jgi:hypothetical protein